MTATDSGGPESPAARLAAAQAALASADRDTDPARWARCSMRYGHALSGLGPDHVPEARRVLPVVSPWGTQEASFGWDLTCTDQHPISGVRHFYAVIGCQEPDLAVALGLDADARTAAGFLRRGQRSSPSQQRQVPVLRRPWC